MAEKTKDLYGALEVESSATKKEIKAAYRKLAAKYHPDVSKEPDAEEVFKRITEAYDVLMDDEQRKEYDAFVASVNAGKVSFDDIVNTFHRESARAFAPMKGETVEIEMEFTVEELKRRVKKEVIFGRYVNCNVCEGHGFEPNLENVCRKCNGQSFEMAESSTPFGTIKVEEPCSGCEGTGYDTREKCEPCKGRGKQEKSVKVVFKIPEGATEGFRYTIKGKGDDGLNGGQNGDLVVKFVHDEADPFEIRNDYDIQTTLNVPFITSLTGGTVKMKSPSGEVIKVPVSRNTQKGHHIILPNEGLFNPGNGFHGNLTAEVNIIAPNDLSDSKINKLIQLMK